MRAASSFVPRAAPRPCLTPRCAGLVTGMASRCETCRRARAPRRDRDADFDARRGVSQPWRKWYSTARWRALRDQVLQRDPLCRCEQCQGGARRVVPSTVVDHIVPHRGDPDLFWDPANLQGLSKAHHDRKTRRGE